MDRPVKGMLQGRSFNRLLFKYLKDTIKKITNHFKEPKINNYHGKGHFLY